VVPSVPLAVPAAAPATAANSSAAGLRHAVAEQGTAAAAAPAASNEVLVKSPIVGTFYEAAAPGAAPFVKVGDRVEPGQILCIIESMKLMNEIEAEVGGVITAKLTENGRPVEYGEALFAILPR